MSALAELSLTVSYFPTAFPSGPAFGTEATTTWQTFANQICCGRRKGDKDGRGFVPARFQPEPDGQVRRIKANLVARTAIVLDIETNKQTVEGPPPVAVAVARIKDQNWAATVYTSHSHSPEAPRYRIVLPLSAEIAPDLPAVEVAAGQLGLAGTLDRTKTGAASLFYLPSSRPNDVEHHEAVEVVGAPISAGMDARTCRRRHG